MMKRAPIPNIARESCNKRAISVAGTCLFLLLASCSTTPPPRTVTLAGTRYVELTAGATRVLQRLAKTLSVGKKGTVTVRNVIGSILVTTWDMNSVHMVAEKTVYAGSEKRGRAILDHVTVRALQEGRNVVIEAVPSKRCGGTHLVPRIDFTLRVPRKVFLQIHAGRGGVTISGPVGTTSVSTKVGNIVLSKLEGGFSVHTEAGNIRITDVTGRRGVATTGAGSIVVRNLDADMTAHVVDGDLVVTDIAGKLRAQVETGTITIANPASSIDTGVTAGSTTVHIEDNKPGGAIRVSVEKGDISFSGPPGLKADLKATAESGVIYCGYNLKANGPLSKTHIHGIVGAGTIPICLQTEIGNIVIRPLGADSSAGEAQ